MQRCTSGHQIDRFLARLKSITVVNVVQKLSSTSACMQWYHFQQLPYYLITALHNASLDTIYIIRLRARRASLALSGGYQDGHGIHYLRRWLLMNNGSTTTIIHEQSAPILTLRRTCNTINMSLKPTKWNFDRCVYRVYHLTFQQSEWIIAAQISKFLATTAASSSTFTKVNGLSLLSLKHVIDANQQLSCQKSIAALHVANTTAARRQL